MWVIPDQPKKFTSFFFSLSPFSLFFCINLFLTGMGRLKRGELEKSAFTFGYFHAGFGHLRYFVCSGELWPKEDQSGAGSCLDDVGWEIVFCSNQRIETRNGLFSDISSCGGIGNQEKCGQKCSSGIRKKSGDVFILERGCQRVGVLEKERNKTRKILIKRRESWNQFGIREADGTMKEREAGRALSAALCEGYQSSKTKLRVLPAWDTLASGVIFHS